MAEEVVKEAEETKAETPEETVEESKGVELEGKMAEFVDWIETITVLELSQLVKALEDRLGVSASAPVAMAAVAGGGAGADAEAAEAALNQLRQHLKRSKPTTREE